MLWNKPETKALAGKLLVVGGNSFAINAPSEAYAIASHAGAGEVKAVLPDSTKKLFGGTVPPGIELAQSSPSGSFSKEALANLLAYADWADMVLLAGDFSRSSETAILLEEFVAKCGSQITVTRDAIEYFTKSPKLLLENESITLVLSFSQLQNMLINSKYDRPVTFSMANNVLVEALSLLANKTKANIITARHNYIYLVADGRVSVTDFGKELKSWRLNTAVHAAVWNMQNPSKPFESLTTAVSQISINN
jgi:hypothetical protein